MINVYVVNDQLDNFSIDIKTIEEDGVHVFLTARDLWGDDWHEYLVWMDNIVIQRVINPNRFTEN